MKKLFVMGGMLASAFCALTPRVSAQQAPSLPVYEDFRRVDRMRRMTGQLETADLLKVTQIDRRLIQHAAMQATNDFQAVWGAAELMNDWALRRGLFESALEMSGSNVQVALRYASAAAAQKDDDTAVPLLHFVEQHDAGNAAPWLVDLRMLQWESKGFADLKPPTPGTIHYRDYGVEAARARIKLLEAAGYSPYAARRLGFAPETPVLSIARDIAEHPIEKEAAPFLLSAARAMQDRPMYLLTELVGETLEGAATKAGVEGETEAEVSMRGIEIEKRREEIKSLVGQIEHNIADVTTETEMIRYFDDVLNLGEEMAMRRLSEKVRGQSSP